MNETNQTPERVKVSAEDKRILNKDDIICPLVFKTTGEAVNYDCTPLSETRLPSMPEDEVGCWRSDLTNRAGKAGDGWRAGMKKLREAGQIGDDQRGFYFTHDEGIRARKAYQDEVLAGRKKANKKSWENRFEDHTGTSYEELEEKFPNLYGSSTSSSEKELVEEEQPQAVNLDALDSVDETEGPSDAAIEQLEGEAEVEEVDAEVVDDGEKVEAAAATMTEPAIKDVAELRSDESDEEGGDETRLQLSGFEGDPFRMEHDRFIYKDDAGNDVIVYLVEHPDLGADYWLTEGTHYIEGSCLVVEVTD